jgi:hypothetical protein
MKRPPKDPTGIANVISLRLSPGHLDRLDAIGERLNLSRTNTVRYMIDHTDLPAKKRVTKAEAIDRALATEEFVTRTEAAKQAVEAAACDHEWQINKYLAYDECVHCQDKKWHKP